MDLEEVVEHVNGLDGVLIQRPGPGDGSPELAWGDVFCYYAPDGVLPRSQPFATIVTKDYPGEPPCGLDREEAFRVNVHAGTAEFRRRIGCEPREAAAPEQMDDDAVLVHPTYGALGWLAVVNPGPRTEQDVRELLRLAHDAARTRWQRRAEGD